MSKYRRLSFCFSFWNGNDRFYSVYFMPFLWNWGLCNETGAAIMNGRSLALGPLYITVQA